MSRLEATAEGPELALENARLRAELRARLDELRACRSRMLDAITIERRRIERDLHDGTQGRLVSLAISLGLLEAKLPADPDGARPLAREAREEVAAALAELRRLSQGLAPSVLVERGLGPALDELCQRAAVPARLELSLTRRFAADVEAAAYFVVSEGLTNAAKHAHATHVLVTASSDAGRLVVEISDDGMGGAKLASGSGLGGLAERIEGLGGGLEVSSDRGEGTTLRAELPLT